MPSALRPPPPRTASPSRSEPSTLPTPAQFGTLQPPARAAAPARQLPLLDFRTGRSSPGLSHGEAILLRSILRSPDGRRPADHPPPSSSPASDPSLDLIPPARPRPPRAGGAADSSIKRLSLAFKRALSPRSEPSLAPALPARNASPASDLTPAKRPTTPRSSWSSASSRPPSPPYSPRREARNLAQNLMGPSVQARRAQRSTSPGAPVPSPANSLLQPPDRHARPPRRTGSPTPEGAPRADLQGVRERQAREDADVLERKRRSQWFTEQASLGGAGPVADVPLPSEHWRGLRREDLEDVMALPGDAPRRRPTVDTTVADHRQASPISPRPTPARATSLYSGSSIFSDASSHHLATVVSPPMSAVSDDLVRAASVSVFSLGGALDAAEPSRSPPPSSPAPFTNPFPLQPSPVARPRPAKGHAPAAPLRHRLTTLLSPTLPSTTFGAHQRLQEPAVRRVGVHAEVHTRETLGRRMRETDWAGDEAGRRRTESVFLES